MTIGANVGTTVTALLATLAVSGANAHAGVEIALVHVLFNLSGIALIYPVPFIRRLPLVAARSLAGLAVESPQMGALVRGRSVLRSPRDTRSLEQILRVA